MIDAIRFKVCGLTSLADAEFADLLGADYLGFNLYPKSSRRISLDQFKAIASRLPLGKKVAVCVEPAASELAAMIDSGFDRFQIHFREDFPLSKVEEWSRAVGPDRLWLAPRLPPGKMLPGALLPLAETFLLDTFRLDAFGGSGRTSDWESYSLHRQSHPAKTWILAGGLDPDNIGSALAETGAQFVDVNSGVETAPGVKDHSKLKAFVEAIHRAAG